MVRLLRDLHCWDSLRVVSTENLSSSLVLKLFIDNVHWGLVPEMEAWSSFHGPEKWSRYA